MIKKYRIKSALENYRASFEMILDDQSIRKNITLFHLTNLVSQYEKRYIKPDSFRESFKQTEVIGNSMNDLNVKDFRTFIMQEAVCHRFWREDKIIESTHFIDKPIDIKDDQEYASFIDHIREDNDQKYLKLAGLSLTDTRPKRRRKKAVV